ncbi:hypothetical protein [Marivita sp.]|uniref:NAD(P)/FAD-dependent oxidoreductase n=1 Tax=Marivita sp. TaxID=2003365 RepID=UPI0025B816C4|nr:hypothetical protein [Marivita sp.]
MASPDLDVAILGAGPAGVAAARGLLAEGWRVAVIDPDQPPAPRIESLPANGLALAHSLGLGPTLAAAGRGHVGAMRLYWRAQPETRSFGPGDAPLLLDRTVLHAALRDSIPPECLRRGRARDIRQHDEIVHLEIGGTPITARFVVDARGRAGQRGVAGAGSEIALAFTARLDGTPDCTMLLHALPDGWLWACTLPDGTLSGAVFVPATDMAGLDAAARAARLAGHLGEAGLGPPLEARAGAVVPAMLQMVQDPFADRRILRIGDAALARNPIASHGLVHALRSGAQAAAAVATLLDADGDDDAARVFIRTSHRNATMAAQDTTARSLADQSLHRTAFWSGPATNRPPVQPTPAPMPDLSQPLGLLPLRRMPMLADGRISWTEAIWLPRSGRSAARFGGIGAAELAGFLMPPAPVSVLKARLEAAFGPRTARALLQELLGEGALSALAPGRRGLPAETAHG